MSFIETIERARSLLERNSRLSLRALQREFDLDDDALEELVAELVEIQRVAVRDRRALTWAGGVPPAPTETLEQERSPRDYTPQHLADKILQSKSALEGERKQVTVLFADVKGSLELAEQVDPEEWHRILDRFFQILSDGVHRFDGTVNQYTGDGIMALFGAPIAHEDHAQRGCYAALRLRDGVRDYADELRVERGLNFGVRIGLNSGEVVVGKIGDDLRMDYTAQGHTVGLAQRMEQLAESGRICLSEHTARLAEGYFDLRDLGASKIKGAGEPLHVYEVEGVGPMQTRLDFSPYLSLTATRGGELAQAGRLAEGTESLQRGLRLAREHDDLMVHAWASGIHVDLASLSGDFSGALAHGRAGVELAERLGSAAILVDAYRWLGVAFILEEDWAEAGKALEHSLALIREARILRAEPQALADLARVHAARGEGSLARATAEEGVAAAQRCKSIHFEIEAQLSLAHVLLADGNLDDRAAIASALDRAAECVGITGARSYLPQIGVERARLARLEGDEAGHERHLREAHRLFTEIGATGHAERVGRELGL